MSSKWEKHIKENQDFYARADEVKESLEHSGVKGMKWGIRRYQDYDGTRLDDGQKVYKRNYKGNDQLQSERNTRREAMSDADLRKATQRMNDEVNYERARRQYNDTFNIYDKTAGERLADNAKKMIGEMAYSTIKAVASKALISVGNGVCEALLRKASNDKVNLASSYGKEEKKPNNNQNNN